MFYKYLKTISMALSYIFITFDQQVKAQPCPSGGIVASAFLDTPNPDFPKLFARSGHACNRNSCRPSACQGMLSSFCAPSGVPLCANSTFCSSEHTPIDSFITFVLNTCTKDQFYYGEYVDKNFAFSRNLPVISFQNNWPNAQGTYEGYGVAQMGNVSKFFNFYHKLPAALIDLGLVKPPICYNRSATAFLDVNVIGSNQLPNFGAGNPPMVPTCAEHTSCPTLNCNVLGFLCCLHGTCICTLDHSICGNPSTSLTTTSTFSCNVLHAEAFYYGEIISTLPVAVDNFFVSSLTPNSTDGSWQYLGLGTIDMSTKSKKFRKDFFFYHKFILSTI